MAENTGIEQLAKPQLPTGEAGKLAEAVSKSWNEHLLLYSQVKNKVLKVNSGFEGTLPFKLEEGKPSPLGLFAEANFKEKPRELPEDKQALETWQRHQRSALLARVIIRDRDGRLYRDVDLKGGGYIEYGKVVRIGGSYGGGKGGLLDINSAFLDWQMSEKFLRVGIRTHRVLAVIDLKELIVEGKKVTVEKARKMGGIFSEHEEKFQPVIAVRAFGTKTRIGDLYGSSINKEEAKLLQEDAKKLVSQEIGLKKILSDDAYLEWFAKTLGHNLGLMHRKGWLHGYISKHNITLDCRIVDLDSINNVTKNKKDTEKRLKEIADARKVLTLLSNTFEESALRWPDYCNLFYQSYDAAFSLQKKK